MRGIYRLADQNIEIFSLYLLVHELCRKYIYDGKPDFSVHMTQEDIAFEQGKSAGEDELASIPARQYSEAYLETLAVYRKIAERMPGYDTFLFHGSCVAVDGTGYLFTAPSGTGKSTHTRLWRELLGNRARMVNDDKPLIHVMGDGAAVIYGTPWDGKHRLSSNVAVPLKAVCILERAGENRIQGLTRYEALPSLIRQTYRPSDPAAMAKTLALLDRMDVQFYRLACNKDISAAELAYSAMRGDVK